MRGYGQLWLPEWPDDPPEGVVWLGTLVVVEGVVDDEPDAALANAAPAPPMTAATPSVTSATRNRLRCITSLRLLSGR